MGNTDLHREKILAVLEAIGEQASSPGIVLICGGTSAVLEGWRQGTVDIDMSFLTEPGDFFTIVARLIDSMDVSVDMVTPASFVPLLPQAESRHELVGHFGQVEIRHFDFYTQALAKLQRGRARDQADVGAMLRSGRVVAAELLALFEQAQAELIRYPAIEPQHLRQQVQRLLEEAADD